MIKKNHTKVNLTSSNLSEEKLSELRRILPEAFSENKIDWEKLRTVLGDEIDSRIEKFNFTWAGKSNAIKNVLIPSVATLRPLKDESIKFDASENLFIEGDNLEVLKLLQKTYFEQVKMIYIDPPYNTGGDFVYRDDFTAPIKNYLEQTGQVDGDGNHLQTNKETSGRYHSDWLSMMYPRLKLAWNLLRDDGVIFVSIDDKEVAHLRMLLDEIFGEENFISTLTWTKREKASGVPPKTMVIPNFEYILVYKKNSDFRFRGQERSMASYKRGEDGRYWRYMPIQATGNQNNCFDIVDPATGKKYHGNWALAEKTIVELIKNKKLKFPKNDDGKPVRIVYADELSSEGSAIFSALGKFDSEIATKEFNTIFGEKIFDFPKPLNLIKFIISQVDADAIILDFFAGSGTTAHAVLRQNQEDGSNRKFILVQLPEPVESTSEARKSGYKTIADITKERIRRVIKGYGDNSQPIDDGFKVFKLAESNYPENNFEFDPEKTEEENKGAFNDYLAKSKQTKLLNDDKAIDVVYENIVKEGFSLNSKITEQKISKNNIYSVADGERQLLVCLDKKIDDKTVNELTGKNYKDKTFICLDNALGDTAKANLGLNVELKTI